MEVVAMRHVGHPGHDSLCQCRAGQIMESVNIRQATDQDSNFVIDVLREAAQWLEERGIALWRGREWASEGIAADVADGLFFIADCSGNAAGVVRFQLEDALFWPDTQENGAAYIH